MSYEWFAFKIDYFDALYKPFETSFEALCELAPPKEVQENYKYLQETFNIQDLAWVGAYKDPRLVRASSGSKILPADGVNGWVTIDGSSWHVTADNPA